MREIKFRAWDKYRNVMEFFEFINLIIDGLYCENVRINSILLCSQGLNNPDIEVMQYVGIKDKNGKEVYEGDIIRKTVEYNQQSYEALYEVIYEDTGFCLKLLNSYAVVNAGIIVSFPYGAFYVIGNIYENPELWKDKKYKK